MGNSSYFVNHIDPNPVEMLLGHVNVLCAAEFQKYLNEWKRKENEKAVDEEDREKESLQCTL